MNITQEQLRAAVIRAVLRLEEEQRAGGFAASRKVYMVCASRWDGRYEDFVRSLRNTPRTEVWAVVPDHWEQDGPVKRLTAAGPCSKVERRSRFHPDDLDRAQTVFPVVPRDLVVKTALCLGDTYETRWIASCLEQGGKVAFLRSGLEKFTGKEPKAYVGQILSYYRQVLEYDIDISDGLPPYRDKTQAERTDAPAQEGRAGARSGTGMQGEQGGASPRSRRVITAGDLDPMAGQELALYPGDIITPMARERAEALHIQIRRESD